MRFINKAIELDRRLCPESGFIAAADIELLADARRIADNIRDEAIRNAARIEETARQLAQEKVKNAEAAAFERALTMIRQLENQRLAFLEGSQDLILDMINAVIDRLMLEITESERITACIARIKVEAPARLQNAVLHVSPEDMPYLPDIDWQVASDPSVQTGSCRLEAEGGVWEADLPTAVESIKAIVAGFKTRA